MTHEEAERYIAASINGYSPTHTPRRIQTYQYWAEVQRVVDADTIDLKVALGFKLETTERFRLIGVNAPEIHGVRHSSPMYARGMEAMVFVQNFVAPGDWVEVRIFRGSREKYGRWLCEIFCREASLNVALLKSGHAVPM